MHRGYIHTRSKRRSSADGSLSDTTGTWKQPPKLTRRNCMHELIYRSTCIINLINQPCTTHICSINLLILTMSAYLFVCMHCRSCHVKLWRRIFGSYGHTASSITNSWQLGRCKAAGTQEIISVVSLPMGLNQPADQRITHRSNYSGIGLAVSICRLLKINLWFYIFTPRLIYYLHITFLLSVWPSPFDHAAVHRATR